MMRTEPVLFRRAGIRRPEGQVFIETQPNTFYTLPGRYDPGRMLSRIVERRFVFLDHWQKLETPI